MLLVVVFRFGAYLSTCSRYVVFFCSLAKQDPAVKLKLTSSIENTPGHLTSAPSPHSDPPFSPLLPPPPTLSHSPPTPSPGALLCARAQKFFAVLDVVKNLLLAPPPSELRSKVMRRKRQRRLEGCIDSEKVGGWGVGGGLCAEHGDAL